MKPRASSSNLKSDESVPMQSNIIHSHQMTKLLIAYNVVTQVTMTIVVTLQLSMGMTMQDLRFTQYGTYDENQGAGKVNSQERSLVQDNPRKRNRNGVNAKYNETIIAIQKQKANFLEEAMKNRQTENEDLLFYRSLLPHVSNIPASMKLRFRNRIQQFVDAFAYPPASSTCQPCPFSLSSPSSSSLTPPSASSTFNSLSSERVASLPAMPEDTYQNYQIYLQMPPFWSSSKSHQYPMNSKVFCMPYVFLKH